MRANSDADRTPSAACPNCGAPVVTGRCSSVTCQNHNGPSAAHTEPRTVAYYDREAVCGCRFTIVHDHGTRDGGYDRVETPPPLSWLRCQEHKIDRFLESKIAKGEVPRV